MEEFVSECSIGLYDSLELDHNFYDDENSFTDVDELFFEEFKETCKFNN